MKKILVILFVSVVLLCLLSFSVCAKEYSQIESQVDELYNSLSEQAKNDLQSISADTTDLAKLNEVSFDSFMNLIFKKVSENSKGPLSASAVVVSVILLNSLIDSYTNSLRYSSTKEVISVISTLCITSTLVMPVIDLLTDCISTVKDASNFMLLYIPVMVSILAFSGHAVSSASYYSFMVLACEGVSRISADVISPLLNVYLSFCVSSSITDRVNLKGFCDLLSKIIKWLISFTMTVFSALMTIKGLIATAYDSVTARAVRFTMSSFIPVVGAALAESYKTIQGSINLLRTGAGVFVILAICVVFLPVIVRCLVWMFSLNLCKSIGEVVGCNAPIKMITSISSVISMVFAITICIMAVFVISTALLITLGGGGS